MIKTVINWQFSLGLSKLKAKKPFFTILSVLKAKLRFARPVKGRKNKFMFKKSFKSSKILIGKRY